MAAAAAATTMVMGETNTLTGMVEIVKREEQEEGLGMWVDVEEDVTTVEEKEVGRWQLGTTENYVRMTQSVTRAIATSAATATSPEEIERAVMAAATMEVVRRALEMEEENDYVTLTSIGDDNEYK